jgi:hypothetical protein
MIFVNLGEVLRTWSRSAPERRVVGDGRRKTAAQQSLSAIPAHLL